MENTEAQVYEYFSETINTLKAFGFENPSVIAHVITGFTALTTYLTYRWKKNKAVIQVEAPFRAKEFTVLMTSPRYSTYGSILTGGVAFTTCFTDGTILRTLNFDTLNIISDQKQIYVVCEGKDVSLNYLWGIHQQNLQKLSSTRKPDTELSIPKLEKAIKKHYSMIFSAVFHAGMGVRLP